MTAGNHNPSPAVIQRATELITKAANHPQRFCLLAGATLASNSADKALDRAAASYCVSKAWAEPDISKYEFILTWAGIEYSQYLKRFERENAVDKATIEILEIAEDHEWKFVWMPENKVVQFPQQRLGAEGGNQELYNEAALRMFHEKKMLTHLQDNWYRVTDKGRQKLFQHQGSELACLDNRVSEKDELPDERSQTVESSQKKYQVFVSSTFEDLEAERLAVYDTLLRNNCIPAGMEMFSAGNADAWEVIKKCIDCCDYFLVIIAHRYGSISASDDMSFTEKEYRYAISQQIPVAALIIDSKAMWPGNFIDKKNVAKLEDFKKLAKEKYIRHWSDINSLAKEASFAINGLKETNSRAGWVRGQS